MGTRAAIIVEGLNQVRVYKHWDGDPDSMMPWLENFNKVFTEERGEDPHYKFAQLLRSSVRDAETYDLDSSEFTGYGVVPSAYDYGEQHTYVLHLDGSVTWHEGSPSALDNHRLKEGAAF